MSYEAQRLINISLGKIASSRNQRGGLRLHKSLMVANVIVNARTYALTDVNSFNPLNRPSTPVPQDFDDEDYGEIDGDHSETDYTELSVLTPDILDDFSQPKADVCAAQDRLETQVPDVEADPFSLDSASYRAKRKRTDSEDSVIPSSDKRLRLEPDRSTPPTEETFTDYNVLISSDNPSDCLQINDLAENFHMSFQGLLHHSHSENCLTFTTEDYNQNYENFRLNIANRLPPKTDSIILCSLQIREALDMLSRPAITMNV